jgi:predicted amidohydrolase YtcJ
MPSSYEIDLTRPLLGHERWFASYPIKSLQDLGATIVSGSDWAVSSMNPFLAMATGVTRADPLYPDRGSLNENERVSLEDMIASYTINAAFVMHQEDVTGSIEVGKSADLIVLDRNIFEVSADELRETKVERTLFKGKTVVERRANSK